MTREGLPVDMRWLGGKRIRSGRRMTRGQVHHQRGMVSRGVIWCTRRAVQRQCPGTRREGRLYSNVKVLLGSDGRIGHGRDKRECWGGGGCHGRSSIADTFRGPRQVARREMGGRRVPRTGLKLCSQA